jgi:hypothetical protein
VSPEFFLFLSIQTQAIHVFSVKKTSPFLGFCLMMLDLTLRINYNPDSALPHLLVKAQRESNFPVCSMGTQ